jgi:hypothetical protein
MGRDGRLECLQGVVRTRLRTDDRTAEVVGEHPDAADLGDREPGITEQDVELRAGEPSWYRVGLPPPSVRVVEKDMGFGQMSGKRSGEHRRGALGRQDRQCSVGDEHRGGRIEGLARLVDDLQHPVADDDIGAVRTDNLEQTGGVAEDAVDRRAELRLVGSSLE